MGRDTNSLKTQNTVNFELSSGEVMKCPFYEKNSILLLRVYQDVHYAKTSNKLECV